MRPILILVTVLLIVCQVAPAETLEEFLAHKIIADYQLDPDLVQINLVRSDLEFDNVDDFGIEAYPVTYAKPRGRFPMRVELSRKGEIVDKGSVSLDVRIFAELPVPIQNIKRHELLSADLFTFERFDITSITEKLLTEATQFENCRAKQNLAAGRYVPLRRIEKVPDIEKGDNVTIVGNGGLFEIRARGVALQTGLVGEKIKVKNTDSRKILVGEVTAPGIVEITI
jgi:flagella basal body P-ring formation protein FlgA